jgi:hypothetical protein
MRHVKPAALIRDGCLATMSTSSRNGAGDGGGR